MLQRVKTDVIDYCNFIVIGQKKGQENYPFPYDLVDCLTDEGTVIPGWYVGNHVWGGYRMKDGMKIVGWKRRMGY